jgi:hypothetical protein
MKRSLMTLTFAVVTAFMLSELAGRANAQPPFATGPDADITGDGLHRVDPSIMGAAWVRPDLDLSRYDRVYLMSTAMQFRDVRDRKYNVRSMETEGLLCRRADEDSVSRIVR